LNGEEKIYECIVDALEELGKPKTNGANILKCCNGIRKHAFGYKWEYL